MNVKKRILSFCLCILLFVTQNVSLVYAEDNTSIQTPTFSVALVRDNNDTEIISEEQPNVLEIKGRVDEKLEIEVQSSDKENIYEYQFLSLEEGAENVLKGPGEDACLDISQTKSGEYFYAVQILYNGQKIQEKKINLHIEAPFEDELIEENSNATSENAGLDETSEIDENNEKEVYDLLGELKSNVGNQCSEDSSIVLTAEILQGNGGYQYQFEEEYCSERKIIQEFSGNAVYNGQIGAAGRHVYYVTIKDAAEKVLELSCVIDVKEKEQNINKTVERALFFGDSLTARNDWAAMYPNYEVKNAGVGSNTTYNLLERVDEIVEWQPDLVFIMGGINDLGQGVSSSQIVGNIEKIIATIQSELPNTVIYLQSILPTDESIIENTKVVEVNSRLESLSESTDIYYVNLYSCFYGTDQIKSELYDESGIHLNRAGYGVWKSALDAVLYGDSTIASFNVLRTQATST